jgi:acyl-coenzyme A synthetase/AMP-(fatty) acid ligase
LLSYPRSDDILKLLLPSPRNSLDGQLSLFSKTKCQTIITTTSSRFPIDTYLKYHPMRSLQIPELKELLASSEVPPYKFNKSFEEAKDEPFAVLHTSGSTGLPKPIVLHHSWFTSLDAQQGLKPFNGYEIQWKAFSGKTVFGLLPPFHVSFIRTT